MKYLNLGCGSRFHNKWTNVDFQALSSEVIAWDLTRGIPFDNESFDVVYHSHVLEHFSKKQASKFLQECYRVLRSGGVIRIVVPDLEQIAKQYLLALEQALENSNKNHLNYEWIMLELYDQAVRDRSGGNIVEFLTQEPIENWSFIQQRWGSAAELASKQAIVVKAKEPNFWYAAVRYLYRFIRYSTYRHECLVRFFLGPEYHTLQLGRFRQSGEVHQWMYDRYSLSRLLISNGFEAIAPYTANSSRIPNWENFYLDTDIDGAILRPDSLFMEAIKPTVN